MSGRYSKIEWQETKNGVTIDCSLDIAVHPFNSNYILLTIPGVDGSVDGYQNKYVKIAENIQKQYGAAVVRIENPYITYFHWESNVRRVLDYIYRNAKEITGSDTLELRIMAHSAGAAVVAHIAWEYPEIKRILLINPATKLHFDRIVEGLERFKGDYATVLCGGQDPSYVDIGKLAAAGKPGRMNTVVLEGVDHDFSGDVIRLFLEAPGKYLFNDSE